MPDQYLARAGGTVHVWKGFSATLAWRVEGLKTYDLFGDSFGWRRPGTEMFIEPGVSFSQGPHTVSFNVPFGYYYNRHPNPYTGIAGDATFPRADLPDQLFPAARQADRPRRRATSRRRRRTAAIDARQLHRHRLRRLHTLNARAGAVPEVVPAFRRACWSDVRIPSSRTAL